MYLIKRRSVVACGLKNNHNVCYINSVIQSLFSCESFVSILESEEAEKNDVILHLKRLWMEMKNHKKLNKLKLYEQLAKMSNSLFKYDNHPGFTENFIEFIANNLDKIDDSNIFMSEKNYMNCTNKSFFLSKAKRHVILISKRNSKPETYLTVITAFIKDNISMLPKILIFSVEPVYKNGDEITIDKDININGVVYYTLRAMVLRKRKEHNEGHFYTIGERNGVWLRFNDEKIDKLTNSEFLTNNQVYLLFYEQV